MHPAGQTPPPDAMAAWRLLQHETRVRYGPVPRHPRIPEVSEIHWPGPDTFVFQTGDGVDFHYRKGEGITIQREPGSSDGDEQLWLNGSVYAAVACVNGFKPIHASAVAHEGKVYAFTGPSGAGKSTLVAALGSRALPMFCDDTLVLDLSDADSLMCLPGHKRLKLTPEAIRLTAAAAQERVSPAVDKFYARPAAGDVGMPLPLAALIFLDEGPGICIEPIAGSQRFVRLAEDHYTNDMFVAASQAGRTGQFELQSRLAQQITMLRLVRPRDTGRFGESVDIAMRYVLGRARPA